MAVTAILLPQARLQFGDGVKVNPNLAGSWNFEGKKFAHSPPNSVDGGFKYAVLVVQPPPQYDRLVGDFLKNIERDTRGSGLALISGGPPIVCGDRADELMDAFARFKKHDVRIVIVIMCNDCYANLKYASDTAGVLTQCVKWKNVERSPRGVTYNIALKLNTKLGGTNNTLVSRGGGGAPTAGVYQDPPASLSWVLDEPCMFVGMDVTHSPKGSQRPSLAAVPFCCLSHTEIRTKHMSFFNINCISDRGEYGRPYVPIRCRLVLPAQREFGDDPRG